MHPRACLARTSRTTPCSVLRLSSRSRTLLPAVGEADQPSLRVPPFPLFAPAGSATLSRCLSTVSAPSATEDSTPNRADADDWLERAAPEEPIPAEWQRYLRRFAEAPMSDLPHLLADFFRLCGETSPHLSVYREMRKRFSRDAYKEGLVRLHEYLLESKSRMPDIGVGGALMRLYTAEGRFQDALRVFDELKRYTTPDKLTFFQAITTASRANESGRALALFEEMKYAGCEPEEANYDFMIRLCTTQAQSAALVAEARSLGFRLNATTSNGVLLLYLRATEPGAHKATMEQFRIMAREGKHCTRFVLERLLGALHKAEDAAGICEVLAAHSPRMLFAEHARPVLWALDRTGRRAEALSLFEELRPQWEHAPDRLLLAIYTDAIALAVAEHQLERALQYYGYALQKGIRHAQVRPVVQAILKACKDDAELERIIRLGLAVSETPSPSPAAAAAATRPVA